MITEKQDEQLAYFKSGVLSFIRKYFDIGDEFDSMLLEYIDGYNLDKLSKNRQNEASAYLCGILDILSNMKNRIDKE